MSERLDSYIKTRADLLRRVLPRHLTHRFAVALGGPYTDDRNGANAFVYRIDDLFLAAEGKIVNSVIEDLVETGPDGALAATAIVFDALVAQAERRAKFPPIKNG